MRRLLTTLILLALVGGTASALDFWAGGNVYYASVIQPEDVRNARTTGLAASDFAFGGEARLYLNAVTGSAVAVFLPGSSFAAPRIAVLTDVGLKLQIPLIRAGIGLGPDFTVAFVDGVQATRAGANLRITGDLVLGDLSLGLSWFSRIDFTRESIGAAFRNPQGFLGLTLLQKL